jgi:galactokinase
MTLASRPKRPNEQVSLFVPGRLCLFGEHSDWAAQYGLHKGHCLVVGTDQGLWATARPASNFSVQNAPMEGASQPTRIECPWDAQRLLEATRDPAEFFRYCAGVAYQMMTHGVAGGLDLRINAMDLPLRKGVSSSAAVCILVARAFDAVYRMGLFPHELMEVAYLGERLTGSQCGRMDQACIYGKTPVLLTFDRSAQIRVEPVFPQGEICAFFVDLGGKKDTVRILQDLNAAYASSPSLQQALGRDNEAIVRSAYHALGAGDASELGELMTRAQTLFDERVAPHSQELQSPLLHAVLKCPEVLPHIYGGKGVGSQGDGTAQFVARSAASCESACRVIERTFPGMRCFPLTIVPGGPNLPR